MSEMFLNLTKGEEFIYKWQFRYLGDFDKALVEVMCRADENNLNLLAKGFPEKVEAIKNYWRTPGWWAEVQLKVAVEKAKKLRYLYAR